MTAAPLGPADTPVTDDLIDDRMLLAASATAGLAGMLAGSFVAKELLRRQEFSEASETRSTISGIHSRS